MLVYEFGGSRWGNGRLRWGTLMNDGLQTATGGKGTLAVTGGNGTLKVTGQK
jgi:hypothetical protein